MEDVERSIIFNENFKSLGFYLTEKNQKALGIV